MLKKLEGNDIGATTYVERAFTYMVVFFFFTFIIDVILLGATFITANNQLNYIATKLQFQNGFIGGGELREKMPIGIIVKFLNI